MSKQAHEYYITPTTPVEGGHYGKHWRWRVGKFVPDKSRPAAMYTVTAVPLGNNEWSYHCDCPAYTTCKHIGMVGEWLRKPKNERHRWYFDERTGWLQLPEVSYDEVDKQIEQYIDDFEQSR
jgi:hypothetical protein